MNHVAAPVSVEHARALLPMMDIRSFLNTARWEPASRAAHVAYRVVFGLDHVDEQDLSLTEQQDEEQIRFGLAGRVRRALVTIVQDLDAISYEVPISSLVAAEDVQKDFFDALIESHDVAVTHAPPADAPISPLEQSAMDSLRAHNSAADCDVAPVYRLVDERLAVGDGGTAARLLDELIGHEAANSPRWMSLRGLAANQTGDTYAAERFFRSWATAGGLELAKANYVLSMLYARHHPANSRCNDVAAALLDEALEELDHLEPTSSVEFEKVFNRNGMALIDFRNGRVGPAIDKLVTGVARLEELGLAQGSHRLHASVLRYNLAQIYRRIGENEKARIQYADLLTIDPNMAEYRVEYAEVLCRLGLVEQALVQLDAAEELEPALFSTADMRGWVLMESDQFEPAAAAYEQAISTFGKTPDRVYNQAYCLLEADRQANVLAMSNDLVAGPHASSKSAMLVAQAHLDANDAQTAVAVLQTANSRFHGAFDDVIESLIETTARQTLSQ